MPGTTAVTNNGSDVSFGKITGYKEVKDYIYKISEKGIIGEHPEWSLSTEALYAKVSVSKERNEYKTAVSYYSDENCTTAERRSDHSILIPHRLREAQSLRSESRN